MRFIRGIIIVAGFILVSCASLTTPKTPDFYPNEEFRRGGPTAADRAAHECMTMADEYIKDPNKYQSMAKDALVGGAVGAGTGALGGVIMGAKVGRATAAGAAVGGTLGIIKSLYDMNERSPSYERFVEHCLQKKGYEVIGWSAK